MNTPIRFTGLTSGIDTQSMVQSIMRAESMRMHRLTARRQVLQWQQEQIRSTLRDLEGFRTKNTRHNTQGSITNPGNTIWNTVQSTVTQLDGSTFGGITVTNTPYAKAGQFTMEVVQTAERAIVRGDAQFRSTTPEHANHANVVDFGQVFGAGSFRIGTTEIEIAATDTLNDVMNKVNSSGAGVTMAFDTLRGVFSLTQKQTGAANNIVISNANGSGAAILNYTGLDGVNSTIADSRGRNAQVARDAIIYFDGTRPGSSGKDGVRLVQASNTFELEGMRIDILNASAGQIFSINNTQNVDAAVDEIRKFVEEYNNLIRQLNALHSTARPRSGNSTRGAFFEPLTDEQRQAMSEREIERWEEQARTGLLHRDSDIRNIQQELRDMVFQPVNLTGGGTISLFQVGITTVGLGGTAEDRLIGVLEIDEDQLRAALEENPERVRQLFARSHTESNPVLPLGTTPAERVGNRPHVGIGFRIDEFMHTLTVDHRSPLRMRAGGATGMDSTDNIISNQIRDYNRRIDEMQQWLQRRENHFYAMFARMEQAMAQANSQMDSLFAFAMQ